MKFFSTVAVTALLGSAAQAATIPIITATYDDITVIPALPAANVINKYRGLSYTGFAVNQAGVGGAAQLTGIAPASKPNALVSGFQQTQLTGKNAGFSVAGTSTRHFTLKSLRYGCSINTSEGAQGVAQQCTFNVRAFKLLSDRNPIATRQFVSTPAATTLLQQPLTATFGDKFHNIQKIEIVQVESASGEQLNVLVIDNVRYQRW